MLKNKYLLMLLIRLFLGYIFFSAGICKLTHGNFGQLIGPPWLEEALAKHGLGLFARIVAISQVICGTLLLSQRYSLLGAVMLVPMNVAILAVTISMDWQGTPYVNAVFLLLNLLLLGMEHRKFLFLLQPDREHKTTPAITDTIGQDNYSWVGIGFCVLTLLMTSVSYTLSNLAALLAFISFAVTIVRSGLLTKLDAALIVLPFVAMILLTFGDLHAQMRIALVAIVGLEAILLCYRLYQGSRNKTSIEIASASALN
jgi:uncharacterized membrane protein YphA (DoxX/SURF4 family)